MAACPEVCSKPEALSSSTQTQKVLSCPPDESGFLTPIMVFKTVLKSGRPTTETI